MDTQQFEVKRTRFWKIQRFFKIPRLYIALLETKDRKRAIFMRGFDKNEGNFAIDRFNVEEKEKAQTYFVESVDIRELVKLFFGSLLK